LSDAGYDRLTGIGSPFLGVVGLDVLDPILYDALVADELARLTVFPEMGSLGKGGEINIGPGPYDLVSADTSKAAAEQYRGRVSQIGLEMMRCQLGASRNR